MVKGLPQVNRIAPQYRVTRLPAPAEHKEQINTSQKEMRLDIAVKEGLNDFHQHRSPSQKIKTLVSCLLLHVTTHCQSKDSSFGQSNFFQVASHLASKALSRQMRTFVNDR